MNTSVGVKALTDICCTSGNAVEVIRSLPETQKIVFAPDRNLGNYIQRITGRKNMVIWDGACEVARKVFRREDSRDEETLSASQGVGPSRVQGGGFGGGRCGGQYGGSVEVRFERSVRYLPRGDRGRHFCSRCSRTIRTNGLFPVPPVGSESGCNECEYMKMVTLEKIYRTLQEGVA